MKKVLAYLAILIIALPIVFTLWRTYNLNQKQVAVLVYHDIVKDEQNEKLDKDILSEKHFEEEMEYLSTNGYKTISVDELYDWKQGKSDIPDKSVVITFDDGFYSFKHIAQPILKKYHFEAICFLIGKTTGTSTPEYISDMYGTIGLDEVGNHDENISYGSHTFNLHEKNEEGKPYITIKSKEELEEDTKKFDTELFKAQYLAYPFYTYSKEFIEVIKQENYKLAFAGEEEMATRGAHNFKIPRISGVKEMDEFKKIFETDKYKNKYGNGLIRKIIINIKRRL